MVLAGFRTSRLAVVGGELELSWCPVPNAMRGPELEASRWVLAVDGVL